MRHHEWAHRNILVPKVRAYIIHNICPFIYIFKTSMLNFPTGIRTVARTQWWPFAAHPTHHRLKPRHLECRWLKSVQSCQKSVVHETTKQIAQYQQTKNELGWVGGEGLTCLNQSTFADLYGTGAERCTKVPKNCEYRMPEIWDIKSDIQVGGSRNTRGCFAKGFSIQERWTENQRSC